MGKLPEQTLRWFEVYTLSETVRIQAVDLKDAYSRINNDINHDPVIGVIEIDLFHKGATQRPDLI